MRPVLFVLVVAASACNLNPPCTKVAKQICDIGPEGDSCAFVLAVQRDDERAQAVCLEVLPAAERYAANRTDPAANGEWQQARRTLETLGFRRDDAKSRIGEKLKASGGEAGKLVDKAERIYEQGEKDRTEAAERILDGR